MLTRAALACIILQVATVAATPLITQMHDSGLSLARSAQANPQQESYEDIRIDPIGQQIFAPRMSTSGQKKDQVDYVVVHKKERKLFLYAGDVLIKSYPIALGKQPVGQKQREGDSRTPEGIYTLDWRNPNSRFFRSIHIDYPNQKQIQHARAQGIDPGGEIMIHGQPSDWKERIALTFASRDWTEGCIAVENQAMLEIWNLVADNTLIEIKP